MKKTSLIFSTLILITSLILTSCDKKSYNKLVFYDGKNVSKINIVPLDGASQKDIDLVKKELETFYKCEISILERDELPKTLIVEGSNKYSSEKILEFLGEKYGNKEGKTLGLVNKTISCRTRILNGVTHKNWTILGLGSIGGKNCVVTTNLINNKKDRLSKVAIHEIGHTLGLDHCDRDAKCLMNDAKGSAKTIDGEKKSMCDYCIAHLEW